MSNGVFLARCDYMMNEFIKLCFTCKKEIGEKDIMFYKDRSFCSDDCRNKEMKKDREEDLKNREKARKVMKARYMSNGVFLARCDYMMNEFIKLCFTCKKEIGEKDIMFYKDRSFCSDDCRNKEMKKDREEDLKNREKARKVMKARKNIPPQENADVSIFTNDA
ncbi:hypothetical protein CTI12_AA376960 [Artemisia annua]|uniref:FLZ-type domain-containing protein n=1 Tax=Artemisia annua TaxID=35608 RepID=A0A2U1MHJ7_ARTAN|nr:hypothetical protein CTI12_AA376960 [Artemisia annua]